MSRPLRVALTGFTPFERDAFESYFRLAEQRTPAYALTGDVASCDTAIANADDPVGIEALLRHGKLGHAVVLGATPCPGAGAQLPRPVNLVLVLRALDTLRLKAPAPSRAVQRVLDDLATISGVIPADVDPRALAAAHAASLQPAAPPPAPAMDHILVVDDSVVALRFMATHLARFGFQVHLARSGAEAIRRVQRRHFEFVFLEVTLEGLDGFHTCRAIKRASYPEGRPPPTVVMMARGDAAVDRLRSTMSGADAFISKPLREDALLKVVGEREVAKQAYVETAQGVSTLTNTLI